MLHDKVSFLVALRVAFLFAPNDKVDESHHLRVVLWKASKLWVGENLTACIPTQQAPLEARSGILGSPRGQVALWEMFCETTAIRPGQESVEGETDGPSFFTKGARPGALGWTQQELRDESRAPEMHQEFHPAAAEGRWPTCQL